MMIDTTNSERWFIRINYWDGDVLDRNHRNESIARKEAARVSCEVRADVDVCHGADVLATFRAGQEVSA
jgi:hypothetical protein